MMKLRIEPTIKMPALLPPPRPIAPIFKNRHKSLPERDSHIYLDRSLSTCVAQVKKLQTQGVSSR